MSAIPGEMARMWPCHHLGGVENLTMPVGFYQLDTIWSHLGKGNLNGRIFSIRLTCGPVCGVFSLISDRCGRGYPTGGGAIPKQADLSCIRKQAEQTMKSKPVSNVVSVSCLSPDNCLNSYSDFPKGWTLIREYRQTNSF